MKLTPQELSVGNVLMIRPMVPNDLATIAGCFDVNDFLFGFRQEGFSLPFEQVEVHEKGGNVCFIGLYSFTKADKEYFQMLQQTIPSDPAEEAAQNRSIKHTETHNAQSFLINQTRWIKLEFIRLAVWLSIARG
jgi:hypothetical protein